MFNFKKLFYLPTPVEMGKSEYNALPSRVFSKNTQSYCWEDYYKDLKVYYPIRYFFLRTLKNFLSKIWITATNPINKFYKFIKYHTTHRYHILDLRQPYNFYNLEVYRYGWQDVPEKMLYAIFNLLDQFIKTELKDFYCPSEEECINNESLKYQRETYFEILSIHNWWFYSRKVDLKDYNDCLNKWFELKDTDSEAAEEWFKKLKLLEEENEAKLDEMILRLMKIRRNLWT